MDGALKSLAKVFVGAPYDDGDDCGDNKGAVFIYSSVTGEFIEKIVAPDGEVGDNGGFGMSVCASESHYVVGASFDDDYGLAS